MKKIDAHLHFLPQSDGLYFEETAKAAGHLYSAAHLEDCFRQLDIAGGIVMSNRGLEPALHRYPDFLRYCIGVDSTLSSGSDMESLAALIEENLRRPSCVGVKLYPGYLPYRVSDKEARPALELARKYGKTVAVHMGVTAGNLGRLKYAHPLTMDDAASAFPDVKFVICHMGNPWLQDAAAVIQKNENVFADLSGLLEGIPDIDLLLEEQAGYVCYLKTWMAYAGYDRLLYGSDWPLVNLGKNVEFFERVLPEKAKESVFWKNAVTAYGLESNFC